MTRGSRGNIAELCGAVQMITSRMRFMSSQLETPLRIVGLSTSLANARDVGEWIGASSHGLFNFPPGEHITPFFMACHPCWLTWLGLISHADCRHCCILFATV